MAKKQVGKQANSTSEQNDGSNEVEVVFLRNNFYRDNYGQNVLLCALLIFIILGHLALTIYLKSTQERSAYFPTTHDNKLIRLVPLDEINMPTEELLGWVKDAAVASYTFNFVNWKEALGNVRQYYTATGYQHFLRVLKDSGSLDDVRVKKLIVRATPTGAPVLLKEGLINKNYSWQIQIPLTLVYQGTGEGARQEITMTMLVTRVSNLESEDGVAIAQLIVTESKANRAKPTNIKQIPKY
jgi:intracellular multiplication protein IcmL